MDPARDEHGRFTSRSAGGASGEEAARASRECAGAGPMCPPRAGLDWKHLSPQNGLSTDVVCSNDPGGHSGT